MRCQLKRWPMPLPNQNSKTKSDQPLRQGNDRVGFELFVVSDIFLLFLQIFGVPLLLFFRGICLDEYLFLKEWLVQSKIIFVNMISIRNDVHTNSSSNQSENNFLNLSCISFSIVTFRSQLEILQKGATKNLSLSSSSSFQEQNLEPFILLELETLIRKTISLCDFASAGARVCHTSLGSSYS